MSKVSDHLRKVCTKNLLMMKGMARARGDMERVRLIEAEIKRRREEAQEALGG
jgi:hypothetical protein